MNIKCDPIDIMVKSKGEKEKTVTIKLFDKNTNKEYKVHMWIWECCFITKDEDGERYCYPGFKVTARCYNKEHKFKITRSSYKNMDVLYLDEVDPILLYTSLGIFKISPYSRSIEMDDGEEFIDTEDGYFSIEFN